MHALYSVRRLSLICYGIYGSLHIEARSIQWINIPKNQKYPLIFLTFNIFLRNTHMFTTIKGTKFFDIFISSNDTLRDVTLDDSDKRCSSEFFEVTCRSRTCLVWSSRTGLP